MKQNIGVMGTTHHEKIMTMVRGLPGDGQQNLVWTPDSGSVRESQNAGCPVHKSHKGQRPAPVNQSDYNS